MARSSHPPRLDYFLNIYPKFFVNGIFSTPDVVLALPWPGFQRMCLVKVWLVLRFDIFLAGSVVSSSNWAALPNSVLTWRKDW
jgi:hypothetical protein